MITFSFYYIEANIVCVIVFAIILIHNYLNIDRQEKQVRFDNVLIAFILYFLADCVWAAIVDGFLPKNLIYVVSFMIYVFMVAIIYNWLMYVMAYEQVPGREKPQRRILFLLPFLVFTVLLIANYFLAPETLISDSLETQPLFNVYLSVVPVFYMIAILFYTISRAGKEEKSSERKKHLFIGLYPLLVTVGGLVQSGYLPYAPIYCCTCLILILVFYIEAIEQRISVDPLTGLNNRGQLTRYCSQRSNLYMDNRLTVVIMIDIDRFKSINDVYGHAEGDKALQIVANALKKAVNLHNMPSFLCRYGGDEFIIITHPAKSGETEELISDIRSVIDREEGRYPLSVSAGFDTLLDAQDSIQDCIIRADKQLYLDKKRSTR